MSGRRGDPTDTSERIEKLKEAESGIRRTADTIEECLRMTGIEKRFGHIVEELRSIASSNSGDSVSNLIKELEYSSEEHPGWTRPFASVKNVERKDI